MSLYNALFGVNPCAEVLKAILGIDQDLPDFPELDYSEWDPPDHTIPPLSDYIAECVKQQACPSGRFRDIYVSAKGTIVLHTRNGSGNRPYYQYVFEIARQHPNYIRDWDDDFDGTYANIEFSVPDWFKEILQGAELPTSLSPTPETPREKWENLLRELDEGADTERTRRAVEVAKPIFQKIQDMLDTQKGME